MAKFEKDYEGDYEEIRGIVERVMRECLDTYESSLEISHFHGESMELSVYTGTCVYFGGRVAALSATVTRYGELVHVTAHSAPGLGAAGIDSKVIRKWTEKLTRAGL